MHTFIGVVFHFDTVLQHYSGATRTTLVPVIAKSAVIKISYCRKLQMKREIALLTMVAVSKSFLLYLFNVADVTQ